MKTLKIASWNACLGISNKLYYIESMLNNESLDVLFIQEAEIQSQTNRNFFNIKNYQLEVCNTIDGGKARTCCYIKSGIKYTRNSVRDVTLEIISLQISDLTINGYYRTFKIPHHNNHREYLMESINALKGLPRTEHQILIGDFNLDTTKKTHQNYQYHQLFDILDEYLDSEHLIQVDTKPTWQRIINNELKESTLDHTYVSD